MPYDRNAELPASVREKYTSKQQRAFRKAYNDAAKRGEPESKRFQIAHAAARRAGDRDATQQKVGHRSKEKASLVDYARTFSADQRKKLAEKGHALPDGSFPIVNKQDLRNAVQAYGRASDKAKAKRHIIKRARALGATDLLPEDWKSDTAGGHNMDEAQKEKKKGYRKKEKDSGSLEFECIDEACGRTFLSEVAAEDHALAVHSHNELREAIHKELRQKLAGPPRQWGFVVDTADDWFVYLLEVPGSVDDKLYRQSYTIDGSLNVTFDGDPTEVRRRVVYEAVATDDAKAGSSSDNPKKPGVKNDSFKCPTCKETFETDGDLKDHKKKKSH